MAVRQTLHHHRLFWVNWHHTGYAPFHCRTHSGSTGGPGLGHAGSPHRSATGIHKPRRTRKTLTCHTKKHAHTHTLTTRNTQGRRTPIHTTRTQSTAQAHAPKRGERRRAAGLRYAGCPYPGTRCGAKVREGRRELASPSRHSTTSAVPVTSWAQGPRPCGRCRAWSTRSPWWG